MHRSKLCTSRAWVQLDYVDLHGASVVAWPGPAGRAGLGRAWAGWRGYSLLSTAIQSCMSRCILSFADIALVISLTQRRTSIERDYRGGDQLDRSRYIYAQVDMSTWDWGHPPGRVRWPGRPTMELVQVDHSLRVRAARCAWRNATNCTIDDRPYRSQGQTCLISSSMYSR